jgi:hypothetical protein
MGAGPLPRNKRRPPTQPLRSLSWLRSVCSAVSTKRIRLIWALTHRVVWGHVVRLATQVEILKLPTPSTMINTQRGPYSSMLICEDPA